MQIALIENQLKDLPIGSKDWFDAQCALIKSRPMLKHCYDVWYEALRVDEASVPREQPGICLELGSGGGYLREVIPSVITSDVTPGVADQVIDARQLPFADSSVRALFLTHVFHHLPDVEQFLREASRVLVPGGVISMIEVAHTPLSRFFFSNFHPEPYNHKASQWSFSQADSMLDANQALSWIVFVRDKHRFEKLFPDLVFEQCAYLPWFTYLASGGVTRKRLVPAWLMPAALGIDSLSKPFARLFALHWHLRIRRRLGSRPGQNLGSSSP